MKKGILISITTLLLFSTLIIFPATQEYVIVTRLGYIEDDIVSGIFSDLLDINKVDMSRNSTMVINLSTSVDLRFPYDEKVAQYSDFIEGSYSNMQNIDVDISDFSSSFRILPYSSTIYLDPLIIKNDRNKLERIRVSVTVSENNYSLSESLDNGTIPVEIVVKNSTGDWIYNLSRALDPYNESTVSLEFDNESLEFQFGTFSGNANLLVESTINASVDNILLEFVPEPAETIMRSGTLFLSAGEITKDVPIIVARE